MIGRLKAIMRNLCMLFVVMTLSISAFSADDVIIAFNIPEQSAGDALPVFGHQADVSVIYQYDKVKDHQTNALQGEYTIHKAIALLLKGTGLEAHFDDVNHLIISNVKDFKSEETMKIKKSFLAVMIGFVVGAGGVQGAITQEAGSNQLQRTRSVLEEVVVTANKREQNLNDVGLTVAVVSGDSLKNRYINSLADLAQAVPSLVFSSTTSNTPVFTLRGVGFNEASLGAYPTVSIYSDEVPLAFPVLASHSAYDLERVEVLKGPQGTLFGQNATGGAINYIAAKPTEEFAAGVDISYGRFDEVIGEGYVSGALSETLNARLSFRSEQANGWQKSNTRPNDTNGALDNIMARLQFAFKPTDKMRFLLNINGWKDESEPQAGQYIGLTPQNPILDPNVAASSFSPITGCGKRHFVPRLM